MTTTASPKPKSNSHNAAPLSDTPSQRTWRIAIGIALVCILAYGPNLLNLAQRWVNEPNYSHGILVPFIAAALLWKRREWLGRAERAKPKGWIWALTGLGVLTLARTWLYGRNELWLETLTFLPALGLAWMSFGGTRMFSWFWPGLLFSLFMYPLPGRIDSWLAFPLQRLATIGSGFLLQCLGVPALTEGNVLTVAGHPLEVARACNGLSMMLTLTCVVATLVVLLNLTLWRRLVLLASAIPIALLCNVLRIAATGLCYQWFPNASETVDQYAHDFAGYAMMPIGFGLVLLEVKILEWIATEDQEDAVARMRASVRPVQPIPATSQG